jgi:hypothetical protein
MVSISVWRWCTAVSHPTQAVSQYVVTQLSFQAAALAKFEKALLAFPFSLLRYLIPSDDFRFSRPEKKLSRPEK